MMNLAESESDWRRVLVFTRDLTILLTGVKRQDVLELLGCAAMLKAFCQLKVEGSLRRKGSSWSERRTHGELHKGPCCKI